VELRAAWREANRDAVLHPFTDMHDLGDGLVRAGLAEPVLDVSRFTLTYPDAVALLRDLRATGAQDATTGRARGLTGRGKLRAMEQAYERQRSEGVLPASCEVVFGQAWGMPDDGARSGEFAFPVAAIGRRDARRG
jgi:malonyl-CoA O-methyltransferase